MNCYICGEDEADGFWTDARGNVICEDCHHVIHEEDQPVPVRGEGEEG